MGFVVLANHKKKMKEIEKREKFSDLTREQKTITMERVGGGGDSNCNWCT